VYYSLFYWERLSSDSASTRCTVAVPTLSARPIATIPIPLARNPIANAGLGAEYRSAWRFPAGSVFGLGMYSAAFVDVSAGTRLARPANHYSVAKPTYSWRFQIASPTRKRSVSRLGMYNADVAFADVSVAIAPARRSSRISRFDCAEWLSECRFSSPTLTESVSRLGKSEVEISVYGPASAETIARCRTRSYHSGRSCRVRTVTLVMGLPPYRQENAG
jgi:hypothetical protein